MAAKKRRASRRGSVERIEHVGLLEAGARVIYTWRKTSPVPWKQAAAETRASYRARMRELLNAIEAAGYEIRK